jgi:hypothetical protein
MKVLVCICSKSPNPFLFRCINRLHAIQIKSARTYEIHVVDSDSDDLANYTKVSRHFPEVTLHMIKNKNYEYGAWKYILANYPSDIYMCIQDTIMINKYIDLSVVNDKTAYTFHHASGFNTHPNIKQLGVDLLEQSHLNYKPIIDDEFELCQHCSFIVTKPVLENVFRALPVPPTQKDGSCCYERLFGLFFIDQGVDTVNLYDFMRKKHGKRR